MSYSCDISFKKIKPEEVYDFLLEFKKTCKKHIYDIAEIEFAWCPFIRNNLYVERDFSKISSTDIKEAKHWALNSIFTFRYFYDKENELLGIYSVENVPQIKKLFDGSVYFQNSTDQDYEREEYKGIELFEQIYDKYMKAPMEDLEKAWNNIHEWNDWKRDVLDENTSEIDMDYYRRYIAYCEIWNKYEDTLMNEENIVYLSLFGPYESQEIYCFIKRCHEEQIKWEDENFKEFKKEVPDEVKEIINSCKEK